MFISDLHLDPETPHVTEAFLRLLEREQTRCDALYILGDFTEVWVGDDDDSAFISHLKGALRLAGRHCKVHLMHGNRDFLIGEAFCRSAAIQLIDDPYVIEAGGRRGVLCHGDTLCSDDVAYQNVRKMFRSPEWQRDMLARGIDERRALAAALRAQSRSANANKAANIMDVAPAEVTALMSAHRADFIIHGHTHRPAIHHWQQGGRTVARYVLGAWARCGWLLRLDEERVALECFALHTTV